MAHIADEVSPPRCATFEEGVHNLEILDAVSASAADHGSTVTVPPVNHISDPHHGKVLS